VHGVRLFCVCVVLCVGRGLAMGSSPVQGVLAIVYFIIILSGVRLSLLVLRPLTGLLYQPHMIGDGDCGEIGGMKIGKGNRRTRRKPAPTPLCPPQIPHD
jgi:hypothetical protein